MADELGYHTAEEIAKLKVFPETEETDGPASSEGYVYYELGYHTAEEIVKLKVFEKTDGPASSEGYVYLVTEVGTNNFKVGRSGNPKRRLRGLQTGNSKKLEMITKRVSDMVGSENRLLQEMKEKFKPTGGGMEWFAGDLEEATEVFHHKVAGSK